MYPHGPGQAPLTLNNLRGPEPLTPKSPILPQPEPKSPGSISQKTSFSRQGTLRASQRRREDITGSMVLIQGRRSPLGFTDRSPQGRRNPLAFSSDHLKSPNDLPLHTSFGIVSPVVCTSATEDQRSPTNSSHMQERRSPIGAATPLDFDRYKHSPTTSTVRVQDGTRRSYESSLQHEESARTPTGFTTVKRSSINLFTPIYFGGEKKSPVGPIPPITVSNPQESSRIAEHKAQESKHDAEKRHREEKEKVEKADIKAQEKDQPEKKSVMREILAFVRKPSKHISTRTNRFAHAFTRAESGSSSGPLIRQSTFSASPAASSTAAKSAVTKQISEVGFEPKMSLKFSHYTKMSLKLRRSGRDEEKTKQMPSGFFSKRASADSTATGLNVTDSNGPDSGRTTPLDDIPFELANVRFEKVGDSYIKHEKKPEAEVSEDTVDAEVTDTTIANLVEEINNSLKIVSLSSENAQVTGIHYFQRRSESREPIEPRISEERESDSNDLVIPEDFRTELAEILKDYKPEPIYINLEILRKETEEAEAAAKKVAEAAALSATTVEKSPLQCPIIEFVPPSRRSSFDPPRSPFLENLRSPAGDNDTELINLQRLDSGGDSFEMVEGDRKSSRAESSFECPYSSRETSFDISRYQSTSYEDQSSSFEMVDIDEKSKKSSVDLRKSSIELLDAETFQRSTSSCGRKSSLETHFDYTPSEPTPVRSPNFPITKKQKAENFRSLHILPFGGFSRARSPLSTQTSSNYSSRDSYDSSSSCPPHSAHDHLEAIQSQQQSQRISPFADPTKKHFPITVKQKEEEVKTFLCTDQRCANIFEPRPSSILTQQFSTGSMSTPTGYASGVSKVVSIAGSGGSAGVSSSSEFEPPSPRRATSASPKHTFTFRIVLKKVDSLPETLFNERHRSRIIERYRRRDSRRKRLQETAGKSF